MAVPPRALVIGLGVTGVAVARQLLNRGHAVVLVDDRPGIDARAAAEGLGLRLIEAPGRAQLQTLVSSADVVLPSPGVPAHHQIFSLAAASGVPVWSEFELASQWSDVPLVAITGTNGKTTVTTLVTEMLRRSGRSATAAGNTDVPLVEVLDQGFDVIVVEASSFRLQFTSTFRPQVGTWLNLAEDHLDWHPTMQDYVAAKSRIWANLGPGDTAIANAEDAVVAGIASHVTGTLQRFSVMGADAEWHLHGGALVGPTGKFVDVAALPRRLPHDLANALAATASAVAGGADIAACAEVLAGFRGLAHRVALVGEGDGVRWFDDSKATTPASVVAAVSGFASVVLIAGGRNKGLDLSILSATVPPVRAVVAIGDAAPDVESAFASTGVEVATASNMADAVGLADRFARPGDAVLLSPGCASFDWYHDYTQRGDDFARLALRQPGFTPAPVPPDASTHPGDH